MYENLGNVRRLNVHVFELLWCDVFALRQLENILCSVDDPDGSIWEDHADVAGSEPAILAQRLLRLLWILEITLKNTITLVADFAPRIWLICGQILHFWNISQSDTNARHWASDVASLWIESAGDATCCRRLSLTVALVDWRAEADLEEAQNIWVDWRGACDHNANVAADERLELVEHNVVPD